MDDRGQGKMLWHRSIAEVAVLSWPPAYCLSGCVGPNAIRYTPLRYNEVVRDTNDQQLLINIVRLRYADSPVFIDLPNITSQFEMSGTMGYLGGYGNQFKGGTDKPRERRNVPARHADLELPPREGREIAKALLTPISSDLFTVVNAGADLEQILLLTTNDINDVANAPRSTTLTPKVPDNNTLLCARYQDARGAASKRRDRAGVWDQ